MNDVKKGEIAFCEGYIWYHPMKILQPDGTTMYDKKGGFATKEEAEESYLIYEEAYKNAYRGYQMRYRPKDEISFMDYLIFWFEEIFSTRIENSTKMVGAYTLYNLISPHITKDIRLRYVNSEYLNSLLQECAKSSKYAGNQCRSFLMMAFKDAVAQGYIQNNPVEGTKAYPRGKPNINILSKEKIRMLLAEAVNGNWYLEILLGLFCGLRKGEILGLKFSDIDMEKKTVTISRQVTANPVVIQGTNKIVRYTVEEKEPKTENSYRTLRVPDVIIQEVEKRHKLLQKTKEEMGERYVDLDYVSCAKSGLPHAVSAMNAALAKTCEKIGLPHVTVHGLRHMYATILIEQGVPLVKISALLGHSSVNTTFEYYCEVMDENGKIMSFMNQQFEPEGSENTCWIQH